MNQTYTGEETKYGMMIMMRYLFVILTACLFIITLTDNVYAIRLNEIESNPEGQDSGNEWVELYSEENVNLDSYTLENGDGGIINLTGSFQGFFVITFQTLWLDNSNETVYLKNNGNIIDTAGAFSDNKKNKTYSFCDGVWIFALSTNNGVNYCSSSQQNQNQTQNQQNSNNEEQEPRFTTNQSREISVNEENNVTELTNNIQPTNPKKIVLNSKKTELDTEITRTYKTRIGVIYFFMALCVLIVLLIAMRKL